jgi:hypothetical protein
MHQVQNCINENYSYQKRIGNYVDVDKINFYYSH